MAKKAVKKGKKLAGKKVTQKVQTLKEGNLFFRA